MSKVAEELGNAVTMASRKDPVRPLVEFLKTAGTTPVPPVSDEIMVGLPREIIGGFHGLSADLDQQSKEFRAVVRLLRQQRLQVEAAETDRDRLYEALEQRAPAARESSRELQALLATTKQGDITSDLTAAFARNEQTLEELEAVVEALSTNLLGLRSSWEQYARTVIRAQSLREAAGVKNG
ncbi:MAG TPA: hypothetical protein VIL65_06630 [Beijerinckiaceae bacterium]